MKLRLAIVALFSILLFSQCALTNHICPCDANAKDQLFGHNLEMKTTMWLETSETDGKTLALVMKVEAIGEENFPTDITFDRYLVSFRDGTGVANEFTNVQQGEKANIMEFYSKPVAGVTANDTVDIAIQLHLRKREVNFLKNDAVHVIK
ncbi:hypothetical protein K4L44_14060 [Halosquirtibacter laminarini]|uniref:Uncharacterized protein n=1 Tax=Halosquirtibacter laminarini TaxID=3374600 RepID=A0AC61NDN9_9BACT|nr:hypothetical protein K4L44_14060 [Prolixibacteraceae bacterium]